MALSLRNNQLFFFPSAKPKTLFNPSLPFSSFIFPNHSSKNFCKLQPRPLLCSVAPVADTQTLPQSAIQRIAEKLRSLGYVEHKKSKDKSTDNNDGPSPGQIFVPLPTQLPKHRVGHTLDTSWSTPDNPVPKPGAGKALRTYQKLRRVVFKERKQDRSKKRENVPTLAELTLPKEELKRLRTAGMALEKKLKVGKAGITEGIVNGIHERWRQSELVKIVCDDICRMNMKRTHELLERKTGGLVIWRSGTKIILYRGADYKYPYFLSEEVSRNDISKEDPLYCGKVDCSSEVMAEGSATLNSSNKMPHPPLIQGVGHPNRVRFQLPGEAQLAQEAERLLEGLGPRFTDWWGYEPLPVDADLLPARVPGFRTPFRMLPYGVKRILTNDEMTTLKRLARPLPCHFALGRNRNLQGLAASIIKLWEKCEVAKIAVKRGVQNTNSKLMAEELKLLTGGMLLSRDREFFVLYRGKDFLPAAVSSALEQRRKHELYDKGKRTDKNLSAIVANEHELQTSDEAYRDENNSRKGQKFKLSFEESKLRSKNAAIERIIQPSDEACKDENNTRKGQKFQLSFEERRLMSERVAIGRTIQTSDEVCRDENNGRKGQKFKLSFEERKLRLKNAAIERTSAKLSKALAKKAQAEKILAELENEEISQQPEIDKEGISEDEKYMLRKIGLSMKPFLLLGRRGVFDGTIENMHLHWKYRELVKIITGGRSIEEVHAVARTLEAESGGILVAVERIRKGYAMIVYRGKNYRRPASLRPQSLLNKKQAMKRSIEAQRRESLKLHVLKLSRKIDDLKFQLGKHEEEGNRELPKGSKLKQGRKQEISRMQSAECQISQPTPKTCAESFLGSQCNKEVTGNHGANSNSTKLNDAALGNSLDSASQDLPRDSPVYESEPLPNSIIKDSEDESVMKGVDESRVTSPSSDSFEACKQTSLLASSDAEAGLHDIKNAGPLVASPKADSKLSAHGVIENGDKAISCRAVSLSNKERLLLRKQALMMRRRPLFAIGKTNRVDGVAEAVKAYFQKHPLAIVNVKGRAKGTSVEEVVRGLEEATGAVLVSRETCKVILYRGWGAEEEPKPRNGKRIIRQSYSAGKESNNPPVISPELISAIRLECGLQRS